MSKESSLKEQIDLKLKPWFDSKVNPPFSVDQLVIMALVSNDKPMTATEVHDWLCSSFAFYRNIAFEILRGVGVAWRPDVRYRAPFGARDFQGRFKECFFRFESSLVAVTYEDQSMDRDIFSSRTTWGVSVGAARIFLEACLAERSSNVHESFPCLRLPAETRLKIYEMVLGLPRAGINISPAGPVPRSSLGIPSAEGTSGASVRALSRHMTGPAMVKHWFPPTIYPLDLRDCVQTVQCYPTKRLLSILSVRPCRSSSVSITSPSGFSTNSPLFSGIYRLIDESTSATYLSVLLLLEPTEI